VRGPVTAIRTRKVRGGAGQVGGPDSAQENIKVAR
jgi:hypothetical protein